MTILSILLEINLMCWLPMLLWLLGAFILGWLLRHLFGGKNQNNVLQEEKNTLQLQFDNYRRDADARYLSLQSSYDASAGDSEKLGIARNKIDELTAALELANNREPVTIEKTVEVETIVEKPVEDLTRINALQAELEQLKADLETERNKPAREISVEKLVDAPAPAKDYKAISAFYGKRIVADDLKLVEGIGPKIEELFHNAGLTTWLSVAESTPQQLKAILDAAGDHYQIHDPGTWPRQCRMMVDDEWAALKAWQEELDGGVERIAPSEAVEKTAPPKDYSAFSAVYGSRITADDLKLVEGIGPKIEELFHSAGLKTWLDVANSTPERLKEILVAGGERFQMHDPATWPEQCRMMVNDEWEALKKFQDELDGGRIG